MIKTGVKVSVGSFAAVSVLDNISDGIASGNVRQKVPVVGNSVAKVIEWGSDQVDYVKANPIQGGAVSAVAAYIFYMV